MERSGKQVSKKGYEYKSNRKIIRKRNSEREAEACFYTHMAVGEAIWVMPSRVKRKTLDFAEYNA